MTNQKHNKHLEDSRIAYFKYCLIFLKVFLVVIPMPTLQKNLTNF